MRIAEAHRIKNQIAEMAIHNRLTRIEDIGDGSHSVSEIIGALYLSVAHLFWLRKAMTVKEREEFVEEMTRLNPRDASYIEHADRIAAKQSEKTLENIRELAGAITTFYMIIPVFLLPRGSDLAYLVHTDPKSDAHREACNNRLSDWYDNMDKKENDQYKAEFLNSNSFVQFLEGLPVSKPTDFWRRVYEALNLPYPASDSDRFGFNSKFAFFMQKHNAIVAGSKREDESREKIDFVPWLWLWLSAILLIIIINALSS